jgi:hypothetical protein
MKHMFLYDCFMVYHHFSLHDTGWCISHFWTNPNLIHEITFLSLGKLPSNADSVGMRWDGHYPTHSSLGPRCKQSKRQPQTPWCSKALREGFHDRFGQKERCLEPRAPKATLVGASTISSQIPKFQALPHNIRPGKKHIVFDLIHPEISKEWQHIYRKHVSVFNSAWETVLLLFLESQSAFGYEQILHWSSMWHGVQSFS